MKRDVVIGLGVISLWIALLSAAFAQEFLNRQPTPDENRRLSGLSYYPEMVRPQYQLYTPGDEEQYDVVLGGSNHNVIFLSAGTSNVQVRLPNCSNAIGARFHFVAGCNTVIKLTNVNGNTFTDTTNYNTGSANAVSRWTAPSNSAHWVWTPNGTNWFVLPGKL